MNTLTYVWRMALRRKAACLLVILFTMAATIFMLVYPTLIENTRFRLEEAYESLEVKGWITNSSDYSDPSIAGELWEEVATSPYFSELHVGSRCRAYTYPKNILEEEAGISAGDGKKLSAFQALLKKYDLYSGIRVGGYMRSFNSMDASDALLRIKDKIKWAEGYDESFIKGNEKACLIPESWGYELGETVPMLAEMIVQKGERPSGIIRMKVVGTYPAKVTSFAVVIPIKTYEELANTATEVFKANSVPETWDYALNSFNFTVKDNRQLMEVKKYMVDQGLDGSRGLRVIVDDRILKGTVSPIESNLALLEGLYIFFFAMVAAIGFFLSFLLAKGRKTEYAIMRMLGESRTQITLKALLEQSVLCLFGVFIGAAAVLLMSANSLNPAVCAVILLCYTLGAALAVMVTVRVNVMEILRDKE